MNDYAIIVYWSDEDRTWIAEAPDLRPCAAHAPTPERAVSELQTVMKEWIDVARQNGMPPPKPLFRAPADAAE